MHVILDSAKCLILLHMQRIAGLEITVMRHKLLTRGIAQSSLGFTYIGVLILVVIMGLTSALAGTLWSFAQQREKERRLIFVGNQFRQAIGQYYERTPGSVKAYPQKLGDLLQDNRYVSMQRYLRRIYCDPITNKAEWGVIESPQGGVMGVASLSHAMPIKQDGFKQINAGFESKKKYADWHFVYIPVVITTR